MSENNDGVHFADRHFKAIDDLCESENYFVPVLKETQRYINFSTAKILDVGCGTGLFMTPVLVAGCTDCYGVDGQHEYLQHAIKRGYKEVRSVVDLSTSTLPFCDEMFDLIVCKDVLEHLLYPLHTLRQIERVLKKNGLLLVHVPNHFPLYSRLKFLFNNNLDTFSYFEGETRWTFPHIRFYEYADFLEQLEAHGFILIKNLSDQFPIIPWLTRFSIFKQTVRKLTIRYPNQFSGAFTLLLKKIR